MLNFKPRKPYQIRASKIAEEMNCIYMICCRELGLDPNFIHQINNAPSYSLYHEKSLEFVDCYKYKDINSTVCGTVGKRG